MARVKGSVATRKRRKRILKLAKGYYGAKHKLFKTAKEQVMNSYYYAFRDRRQKKRDFRKLWIARINAAARMNGLSYSKLMHGLKLADIEVNRKMLADIAIADAAAFTALAEEAKKLWLNNYLKKSAGFLADFFIF
ncbi:50S ribosomal protein L20 [Lactococcus lactis]|nr:50S ribosomal protein L20 [Lactococcus lactis]